MTKMSDKKVIEALMRAKKTLKHQREVYDKESKECTARIENIDKTLKKMEEEE